MRTLRTLIQSPAALFAFEAAARHLSFTRAARELNVTQAAVSYNVKQLEQALGVRLFDRKHRAVALTDAGERFYNDVSIGLTHIRRSAESISRIEEEQVVTLSCSTAFANYWVVPRLASFRKENPDVDIRLQTTDKDVDLVAEGISLGIRRGLDASPGCDSAFLAKEEVLPVASPAYVETHSRASFVEDISTHELIHLDEPFRQRPQWKDWARYFDIDWQDDGHGLRLNDYGLVVQAAMAGEGVALGWRHIVQKLVDQGLLAYLWDKPYTQGLDFYVTWDATARTSPQATRVRDWLLKAA